MAGRSSDPQKRQAIIGAATRLFLKDGFGSTSMDDVARLARVTKQTVYAHFKNKDTLFGDIIAAECLRHSPNESMMTDEALPIEQLLFRVGQGFLAMISDPKGLAIHRLVMSEADRKPALAKLFYETGPKRMNDLLTEYLARQNDRGVLHIQNPASAASYFYSLLKGRYHLRMALKVKPLPTRQQLDAHVQETVTVFMHLYGGKNPINTQSVLD
ncbi:MAG: TetR/AcrR family transcriptional regulator [Proteobacteria bacterium]|nr:TetR/AcrR family transcriptional regulator [Pseudomonadota bacterium]